MADGSENDVGEAWKTVLSNPWVQVLLGVFALVLVGLLVYGLSFVLIPLLLAFLAAYIFDPFVDFFEKRGVRRGFTIICLAIVGVVALLSIPIFAVPNIIDQADNLRRAAVRAAQQPEQVDTLLEEWIDKTLKFLPLDELVSYTGLREQYEARLASGETTLEVEDVEKIVEDRVLDEESEPVVVEEGAEEDAEPETETELEGSSPTDTPPGVDVERPAGDPVDAADEGEDTAAEPEVTTVSTSKDTITVDEIPAQVIIAEYISRNVKERLQGFLLAHRSAFSAAGGDATESLANFFASIGRGTADVVVFLGNLALFSFVAGYLLKDYDKVVAEMKTLVPPRWRDETFRVFGDIDKQLRGFLVGQLTVCACLAVMYAIGMLISGVPFAIFIALFGGLASLIPFFGVILTFIPAAVLTMLQYGFDWHIVAVVITFVVVQALEGNVITPNIMGNRVGLHPVWVILAVMVFGSLMGFTGLLIAVPLSAVLKVFVLEAVSIYKDSSVFKQTEETAPPVAPVTGKVPAKRPARTRRRAKGESAG